MGGGGGGGGGVRFRGCAPQNFIPYLIYHFHTFNKLWQLSDKITLLLLVPSPTLKSKISYVG